ncbi:MAG: hypothetical protein Kow00104_05920 [Rhodothalassiaceae bacterium]
MSAMRMMFRTAAILLLGLALAGCATKFRADVAQFHKLGAPSSQSFKIVAIDPDKQGSLEFEQYAGLVRAELMDHGYQPTAADPDLIVEFDYLLSEGRERIYSRPGYYGGYPYYTGPFFHPYGFHGIGYAGYGGFYGGGYGYGGNNVYSTTVYSLRATLVIKRADGEIVYEGRADTTVGSTNLPEVMPWLVQAIFTDFPGESGRTRHVVLKLPKDSDLGY